jgi:hypothetical protein
MDMICNMPFTIFLIRTIHKSMIYLAKKIVAMA